MTEFPPPPPQRTSPTDEPGAIDRPGRLAHPLALFAVTAGIGLVAALVVGFGIGWVVAVTSNADCSTADGWCELGGALYGLLLGGVAGLVTYVTTGIVTIVRCRQAGRARTLHILAHLAVIPGLPIVLITVANVLP